ncbi:MAG TPA: Smr/MutS family protein [Cyclobacteriaceae bacterium]|nr:Smr/MutS family protein [Cyclobacteriaceae bacterium]
MNIGDKVRLLRGNEEGVITKISAGGRIEIEIEDGFRIPAMKNEVVVISAAERQYFGDGEAADQASAPTAEAVKTTEAGLFLAFIPLNDKNHSMYFVNNTDRDFVYSISERYGEDSRTLKAGLAPGKSYIKVGEKSIENFEEWPSLNLIFIPVNQRVEKTLPPFEKKVKFKASLFFKNKKKIPQLEKQGFLLRVDHSERELSVKQLNEALNEKEGKDKNVVFQRPAKEIDLHIEKLTEDHAGMSNSEILKLQMETFEKNLNYAIATGMDEITFIHGIGNGVLKKEIHKYVSLLDNIKYFQDTQKSRFGYGATLIRIN